MAHTATRVALNTLLASRRGPSRHLRRGPTTVAHPIPAARSPTLSLPVAQLPAVVAGLALWRSTRLGTASIAAITRQMANFAAVIAFACGAAIHVVVPGTARARARIHAAITLDVTHLATGVALVRRGPRALLRNVADLAAVIALLALGGFGVRAFPRDVAVRPSAVIAFRFPLIGAVPRDVSVLPAVVARVLLAPRAFAPDVSKIPAAVALLPPTTPATATTAIIRRRAVPLDSFGLSAVRRRDVAEGHVQLRLGVQ